MGRHPTILIINFMFIMLIFIITPTVSGPIYTQFLTPNFTASNYQFIDNSGAFLSSPNATFLAAISSAPWAPQQPSPAATAAAAASAFYFSILHAASNEIIWTANRASPISNSDKLTLTPAGLALYNSTNAAVWSTPPPPSPVASLELRDDGNLVLLDRMNRTLWESFDYPTDTVVPGQRLPVGKALAAGEYRFSVTASDAVLRWSGADYWKLSMDPSAFNDAVSPVEYMEVDSEGFYLVGANRSVIFQVTLSSNRTNGFRVARLNADGRYVVKSYVVNQWTQNEFTAPGDDCQLPMSCGSIGLCVDSSVSNSGSCTCSSGFRNDPNLKGCTPASFSLPGGGCDAMNNGGNNASSNLNSNSSEISYVKLDNGIDYFANKFVSPIAVGMSSTLACETLCTNNCSCLGFFFANSSGSCYLIKNQIGSVTTSSANGNDRVGYIKAIGGATNGSGNDGDDDQGSNNFPIAALVLLPSAGFFLLVLLLVLVFIKRRRSVITKKKSIKLGRPNSNSSSDLDAFSIPGLPVRFDFDELEGATENFGSQIGSGGFGSVYKGTLADKSVVAVKKINNLGNQGKKEFCTEIAIIGKIHHVNLVRLRGFCAEGSQRLLVYEYMNRGSLDRTLFGAGPAIEWQERVDIALGTARGLAYLHSGCENKIIHCDIKPENILLHDHFHVKISDFGLSKLLSPEQSSHFTTMRGTRGYLAPEWLTSSAISDKTDVYSYGMVLLELVSGRKNCSMRTQSHSTDGETTTMSSSSSIPVYFPLLALDMHEQGRYVELADPRLEGRVTNEAVEKLVRIALCCVHEDPNLRPTMVNVVSMLEGTIPLGKPRGESLNFLRFYGRRFNESSVLGGSNGDNRFMGFSQVIINASHTSTTSGSGASYSYISSQQISGPR